MAIKDRRRRSHQLDQSNLSSNQSESKKYQLSLIESELGDGDSRANSLYPEEREDIWAKSQRYTPHHLIGESIPPTMITNSTHQLETGGISLSNPQGALNIQHETYDDIRQKKSIDEVE